MNPPPSNTVRKTIVLPAQSRKESARFVKFLGVGALGFVVDGSTFNILTALLHWPAQWAQVMSFAAAVVSNFTLNRFWTYPESRSKSIKRQLVQFTVVNLAGLGIRSLIFRAVTGPYLQLARSQSILPAEFLANNAALATAVSVVLLWNFFVNRYWTYNDVG